MITNRLFIKFLCLTGKAIDIRYKSRYPANVLSNLYPNEFEIDGVCCGSMEGFLQSLKYKDEEVRLEICKLAGKEAKAKTTDSWIESQTLYWKENMYKRDSDAFQGLIHRAYSELYAQNACFRKAISEVGKKKHLSYYR